MDPNSRPSHPSDGYGLALDHEDAEMLEEAEANPDALTTDTPNNQKLKVFSVVCLIANRMIGTGIYSTPSRVVAGTDSIAVSLIFWVVGAIIAFIGLSMFIELGLSIPKYQLRGSDRPVAVPRSGGEKNYLEFMYRRPKYLATCVFAFCFICLGNTGGNAIAFAEHFLTLCGVSIADQTDAMIRGVAIATITFACLLHGLWRAGGIYTNNILACLKIGTLLLVIGSGLAAYGRGIKGLPESSIRTDIKYFGGNNRTNWGISDALLAVIFSYSGFTNANYVLSEISRPQRTLKVGGYAAVGLVSVLYCLSIVAYSGVLSKTEFERIDAAGGHVGQLFFEQVFGNHMAENPGRSPAVRTMSGLIALSSFGNIIVVTFVAARVKQEIAKEGVLPFSKFFAANSTTLPSRYLKKRNPEKNKDESLISESTPVAALFLHWIFSIIVCVSPPPDVAYKFFVGLYAYSIDVWIGFLLAAGLLWLRFKPGSTWTAESNFKPWGGPTQAIIYLLVNAFLIISPFIHDETKEAEKKALIKANGKTYIPWYVSPTMGTAIFLAGGIYWALFRYVWPKLYHRELRVERIPILLDRVQINEIVICSWVVPGAPETDFQIDTSHPSSNRPATQSPMMPFSNPAPFGSQSATTQQDPFDPRAPFSPGSPRSAPGLFAASGHSQPVFGGSGPYGGGATGSYGQQGPYGGPAAGSYGQQGSYGGGATGPYGGPSSPYNNQGPFPSGGYGGGGGTGGNGGRWGGV